MEFFIHWLLAAFGLIATGYIVPGFFVENIWTALLGAIVLSLLNTLVWPVLAFLTLPLTVLTFGLFLFILNAIILKFGAALVPGFTIVGFVPAIIGAVVLTAIGWIVKFVIYYPAS